MALRADLQKRLEQLKQRLVKNARIQEGDKPEEDPAELQSELEKSARELTLPIQRINRTNAASSFGTAGTLADALAERDVLKIRYNAYRQLANAASTSQGVSISGSALGHTYLTSIETATFTTAKYRSRIGV